MDDFLNGEILRKGRERAQRRRRILWAAAVLAVLVFTVLCACTRTGNARILMILAGSWTLLTGWGLLAWRLFFEEPAQAEAEHLKGLAETEAETREGRITLSGDVFRIPRSVRVRKVRLETEEETLSLNLNEKLTERMPPDGSRVRVRTARKFITGLEVLEPGPEERLRKAESGWRRAAHAAGRFFPAAVIWAMMAVLLTGFVFNRITETDPAHKIVIYADCEVRGDTELAEKMEQAMDGAVRMVKVHPFSYAMFGSEALKSADLYIIPDSRTGEYADWLEALPGTPEEGIILYDPAAGAGAAEDYFIFAPEGKPAEIHRLYFGRNSVHREDGLARRAAELLTVMANTAEEENP